MNDKQKERGNAFARVLMVAHANSQGPDLGKEARLLRNCTPVDAAELWRYRRALWWVMSQCAYERHTTDPVANDGIDLLDEIGFVRWHEEHGGSFGWLWTEAARQFAASMESEEGC